MGKKWTDKEIHFLEENYGVMSFEEISFKLERTCGAIKRKGSYLGLSDKKIGDWTEEEVEYILKHYKTIKYEEIAEKLGRTYLGVKAKGKRLGIDRMKFLSDTTLTGRRFGRLVVVERILKGRRYWWSCLCNCGKECLVETNHLKNGHVKSCGCYSREMATGKNNWKYNPTLTNEERLKDRYQLNGVNLIEWRATVFEKDRYTCQICSRVGGKLNAHHINSWDSFPDERFDSNNGVTLCVGCHRGFHKEFGYGNNTAQQFEEFKILRKEV